MQPSHHSVSPTNAIPAAIAARPGRCASAHQRLRVGWETWCASSNRVFKALQSALSGAALLVALTTFAQGAQAGQRYLINFSQGSVPVLDTLVQRVTAVTGYAVMGSRALIQPGTFVVELDAPPAAEPVILAALRALSGANKVHPDYLLKPAAGTFRPNDPLLSTVQSSYMNAGAYAALNMPAAWGISRGSSRVTLAVLDSGVLFDHPELRGRLLRGYDFVSDSSPPTGQLSAPASGGSNDGNGRDPDAADPGDAGPPGACGLLSPSSSSFHGTAVASVAAANTDNATGMAGIDTAVRVLPLRISGQCGVASTSDILDAMYWAVGDTVNGIPVNPTPARVVNLSFAASLGGQGCTATTFPEAIARLRQRGAVFVASAGNSGTAIEFPANCPGAVAVGTVSPDGRKVSYSAYGPQGTRSAVLMAPADAQGFYAVAGNNQFADGRPNPAGHTVVQEAGTSFSSPLVAGVFALTIAARPELPIDEVISIVRGTAKPFPASGLGQQCPPPAATPPLFGLVNNACACTAATCGNGIVAPLAALERARQLRPVANVPPSRILSVNGPVTLDGSLSTAAGSGTLQYRWRQINGDAWALNGVETAQLQGSPPPSAIGSVFFELTVTDSAGGLTHAAVTSVLLPGGGEPAPVTPMQPGSNTPMAGDPLQPSGGQTMPVSSGSSGAGSGGGGGGGGLVAGIEWLLAGLLMLRMAHRTRVGAQPDRRDHAA